MSRRKRLNGRRRHPSHSPFKLDPVVGAAAGVLSDAGGGLKDTLKKEHEQSPSMGDWAGDYLKFTVSPLWGISSAMNHAKERRRAKTYNQPDLTGGTEGYEKL